MKKNSRVYDTKKMNTWKGCANKIKLYSKELNNKRNMQELNKNRRQSAKDKEEKVRIRQQEKEEKEMTTGVLIELTRVCTRIII